MILTSWFIHLTTHLKCSNLTTHLKSSGNATGLLVQEAHIDFFFPSLPDGEGLDENVEINVW